MTSFRRVTIEVMGIPILVPLVDYELPLPSLAWMSRPHKRFFHFVDVSQVFPDVVSKRDEFVVELEFRTLPHVTLHSCGAQCGLQVFILLS